jgi:iron complex outermembrane receptor protein
MFKYILLFVAIATIGTAQAQHNLKINVTDKDTNQPLSGVNANIGQQSVSANSDEDGNILFENLQAGVYAFSFQLEGYETESKTVQIPLATAVLSIYLKSTAEEMEEIIITSTRGTRTISNIPTRVEFIAGEELEEKANMKPGDIRMMLNESTGIQTQQTSATSGNSSIRIQGLDGRYTQILKDGFPL